MDIMTIPTSELLADLAETEQDIMTCRVALLNGVQVYGDGESVLYRLTRNQEIRGRIKAELARRDLVTA